MLELTVYLQLCIKSKYTVTKESSPLSFSPITNCQGIRKPGLNQQVLKWIAVQIVQLFLGNVTPDWFFPVPNLHIYFFSDSVDEKLMKDLWMGILNSPHLVIGYPNPWFSHFCVQAMPGIR